MKSSLFLALAAVSAIAVAQVYAARFGVSHRSLLQQDGTDSYYKAVRVFHDAHLNISNSTIFAWNDQYVDATLAAMNLTWEKLQALVTNHTYEGQLLLATGLQLALRHTVSGIMYPSSELAPGNTTLTTLSGENVTITNNDGKYTFNGSDIIVSLDNEWQGNLVHVLAMA